MRAAAPLIAAFLIACGQEREVPRATCPPPPPGEWIAAGSDADGSFDFDGEDADLVLVRTDGARRRRLTAARGNDFSPSWSPSGDEIVFRSNRDRADALDINDELYAICADGSRERRLTNTPDVQERSPAVSPDGRLVAFAAETRDHILDIHVMRRDGSGRRNLTAGVGCGAEYPTWSPDGRWIAFHCFHRLDNLELYVMAADGSDVRRLTRAEGEDSYPAWSPDGRTIAYGRGEGDIALIRPDGGGHRMVTRDPAAESFPSWSPDGRRLVVATDHHREELSYQLRVVSIDVSYRRTITRGRASHFTPAWQPRRSR